MTLPDTFCCPGSDTYAVRRWLLIVGPSCPTDREREHLRSAALRAHRLMGGAWGVICGDDSAGDLDIAMTCEDWRIPLRVCGLGVNPSNSIPRRFYERIILAERWYTRADKHNARWRYMLPLAAGVVVVGDGGERWYRAAVRARKPAYWWVSGRLWAFEPLAAAVARHSGARVFLPMLAGHSSPLSILR